MFVILITKTERVNNNSDSLKVILGKAVKKVAMDRLYHDCNN